MLIVIPARFDSMRFPGKPLTLIHGRPLIQWTYEAACGVPGAEVVIATDDARIGVAAAAFGAPYVMTGPCRNGTERVAAAAALVDPDASRHEIVINWQGDAPLIPPAAVRAVYEDMVRMARCDVHTLGVAVESKAAEGSVEVSCGPDYKTASAFTRAPSPPRIWHVGLYAMRRRALAIYPTLVVPPEEIVEGLEQLRWLAHRFEIGLTLWGAAEVWPEVNYPQDVARVEALL